MSRLPRVVFWQNFCSPHQRDLLAALASRGVDVVWVVDEKISMDREALGWQAVMPPGVHVFIAPNESKIKHILLEEIGNTIHFCSLSRRCRVSNIALKNGIACGAKMALYSEYFDTKGIYGVFRKLRGALYAWRMKRKLFVVLAIGRRAKNWFVDVGFDPRQVKEFGYFVDCAQLKRQKGTRFKVVYAGRLVVSKGCHVLLAALAQCGVAVECSIVGSGPEEGRLRELTRTYGIANRVEFLGPRSRAQVIEVIASSNALILPSIEKEGWGVVINEALLQGTPVVCSCLCGASCLVEESIFGHVVRPGSVEDICDAIRSMYAQWLMGKDSSEAITLAANEVLSPDRGAAYLLSVCQGRERPGPWYEESEYRGIKQ